LVGVGAAFAETNIKLKNEKIRKGGGKSKEG